MWWRPGTHAVWCVNYFEGFMDEKTVIFITSRPYPNGMAATNRLHLEAKALQEQGIKVEVLITRPTEHPDGKPRNTMIKGIFDGVPFQYQSKTTIYSKSAFIRKIQLSLGFIACLYRLLGYQKGDCVFF